MRRCALLLLAAAAAAGDGPKEVAVKGGTAALRGTLHPAGKRGAGVVLLHRPGATDWEPLVRHLAAREISVLVLAREDGAEPTAGDAAAGLRHLAKTCDRGRIGLGAAGASCTAALAADGPAAVFCLDPAGDDSSLDDAGVPLEGMPIPVVFVGSDPDTLDAFRERVRGSTARLLDVPADARGARGGTGAFGAVPLVEAWVAGWCAQRLDPKSREILPDGELEEGWAEATQLEPKEGGRAYAYLAGTRLVFGGEMPAGKTLLRLKVRAAVSPRHWDGKRVDATPGKYSFLAVVLEAPDGYVRRSDHNWKDAPDPGGKPPAGRLPGCPARIVFKPRDGGWCFEGELWLPALEKRRQVVDVEWGWEDALGGGPTIRIGPGGEIDLHGTWVRVEPR